jgi:hypothetical protein
VPELRCFVDIIEVLREALELAGLHLLKDLGVLLRAISTAS